jgi:hypothetical protein
MVKAPPVERTAPLWLTRVGFKSVNRARQPEGCETNRSTTAVIDKGDSVRLGANRESDRGEKGESAEEHRGSEVKNADGNSLSSRAWHEEHMY